MVFANEAALEAWALDELGLLGHTCLSGSAADPDAPDPMRGSYRDTILLSRLQAAIRRLNPGLPDDAVRDVVNAVRDTVFAGDAISETAAVVLVDSSHEDQLAAFSDDMVSDFRAFPGLLSALSGISMTGLLHLWNPLEAGATGLEGHALVAARSFAGDRVHLATSAEELRHWDAITARAVAQDLPADLPVLAVTAGSAVPGSEDFSDLVEPLHREIASRFTIGEQVTIERADHFSVMMNEDHAGILASLRSSIQTTSTMSPACVHTAHGEWTRSCASSSSGFFTVATRQSSISVPRGKCP